jgi:hypothetical protein
LWAPFIDPELLPDFEYEKGVHTYSAAVRAEDIKQLRAWFEQGEESLWAYQTNHLQKMLGCFCSKQGYKGFPKALPKHTTRVSLFGGTFLPLAYPAAKVEVWNDLPNVSEQLDVVGFFETLLDEKRCAEMALFFHLYGEKDFFDVVRAQRALRGEMMTSQRSFLVALLVREALQEQKKRSRKLFDTPDLAFKPNGVARNAYTTMKLVDPLLPAIHGRLFRMQVESYPWEKVIEFYDGKNTLLWVDLTRVGDEEILPTLRGVKSTVVLYDEGSERLSHIQKELGAVNIHRAEKQALLIL